MLFKSITDQLTKLNIKKEQVIIRKPFITFKGIIILLLKVLNHQQGLQNTKPITLGPRRI